MTNMHSSFDKLAQMVDHVFGEKMITSLLIADEISLMVNKIETILRFSDFATKEKLPIPEEYIKKINDYQMAIQEQSRVLATKVEEAFTHLTYDQLIHFASSYEKVLRERSKTHPNEPLHTLDLVLEQLSDEQKKRIFLMLHEKGKQKNPEGRVIRQFESKIRYPMDMVCAYLEKKTPINQHPFLMFFQQALPFYEETISDTLKWLEEDFILMDIEVVVFEFYADTILRRHSIPEERKEEMVTLLKNYIGKKVV